jgi:tRNA pseudouridine55 synthase
MVGQATRLSQIFLGLAKEYELTIQFGHVSSTGDPSGEIERRGGRVSREAVLAALDGLRGNIVQQVPLTSAVKVGGERLYKKAHRGEHAETPSREVTVHDLVLLDFAADEQTARVLALTSSGTYLRVIAQDLGEVLGVGAYALALRRTRIGRFNVARAASIDTMGSGKFMPSSGSVLGVDEALEHLPVVDLDEVAVRLATNGNELRTDRLGRFRVRAAGGRLLAVYDGTGRAARPVVVFPNGADCV